MLKHYIVYEIKNNITGRKYVGAHETSDLNDGYMGSGASIQKAIKKHGVENFTKTVLGEFDTREAMYEYERSVVTEDFVAQGSTYNQKVGGVGGWDHVLADTESKSKGGKTASATYWERFYREKELDTEWYRTQKNKGNDALLQRNKTMVLSEEAKRRRSLKLRVSRQGKTVMFRGPDNCEHVIILKTEVAEYEAAGWTTGCAPKRKKKV